MATWENLFATVLCWFRSVKYLFLFLGKNACQIEHAGTLSNQDCWHDKRRAEDGEPEEKVLKGRAENKLDPSLKVV